LCNTTFYSSHSGHDGSALSGSWRVVRSDEIPLWVFSEYVMDMQTDISVSEVKRVKKFQSMVIQITVPHGLPTYNEMQQNRQKLCSHQLTSFKLVSGFQVCANSRAGVSGHHC
jgi:hypothetical protein